MSIEPVLWLKCRRCLFKPCQLRQNGHPKYS